jgi:Kef-type K+ transport system membrane component KefB
MQLLNLDHPHGTAWELLVVVVVIIVAPIVVEKVRIPGLIGLLIGGCVIGPNVLGVVSDSHGILDELGDVGLLYLMFVAGLELKREFVAGDLRDPQRAVVPVAAAVGGMIVPK